MNYDGRAQRVLQCSYCWQLEADLEDAKFAVGEAAFWRLAYGFDSPDFRKYYERVCQEESQVQRRIEDHERQTGHVVSKDE